MTERSARQFAEELVNRRGDINRELSRNGVRFGVYRTANTTTGCFHTTRSRASSNPTNSTSWKPASSSA